VSETAPQTGTFVGLNPWLPWPLSAWRWWSEPVPAQRLASLRIGLAVVLLVDLLTSYGPHLHDLFGPDSLGSSELFSSYTQSPRWRWSIFRGFDHPLLSGLALGTWIVASLMLVCYRNRFRIIWIIWLISGLLFQFGLWSREIAAEKSTNLGWLTPLVAWIMASMFLFLVWKKIIDQRIGWILVGWLLTTALLVIGIWMVPLAKVGQVPFFRTLLQKPGDSSHTILQAGFFLWLLAVIFLLLGFWTKTSAVIAWMLSTSFANLNPNIDNAGDTVRGIILFYLMLCPCGAAWSIDSLLARRCGRAGPVFVSPWALRLLLVQMILIYFMNGIYKLAGPEWREGSSLYYVLSDLTLARFSYAQIDLPLWLIQFLSWSVLVWEVGFPVWVALPWTRTAALLMGVAFHLGIMLTMELGGFGPYMLTLYLPLVPWERFSRSQESGIREQQFDS
jgi:hypothetical protein